MDIAALISFAVLLLAWILAPNGAELLDELRESPLDAYSGQPESLRAS